MKMFERDNLIIELSQIFSRIPFNIWNEIVKNEPEWYNMKEFLFSYGFGPFSVLMITAGLNDYQLKGKAELAYWPKIKEILKNKPIPSSRNDLYNFLVEFYKNERLHNKKIERLKKFLNSELSLKLWNSNPKQISEEFLSIWGELAIVMEQNKKDKTIVFAMKCLGISLLMEKEYSFDFSPIPIPVDFRIRKFTQQLGLENLSDDDIRNLWKEILKKIKEIKAEVNMIHLDSLIWQIGALNRIEFENYFKNLCLEEVGNELINLLKL
jgi:DNA-(apurinic or apyrimidinic site) lyase